MSAVSTPPLTLIVAATVKNGIGKNGGMPWPMLKREMAYFAGVTTCPPPPFRPTDFPLNRVWVRDPASSPVQNVVVMGRKTWESIPPKNRPLKHRTNIVISRQDHIESISDTMLDSGEVLVAKDISSGLAALQFQADAGMSEQVGRVFVIGGGTIYKAALEMPEAKHVLLTRVFGNWDCDTQFPVDLDEEKGWSRRSKAELEEYIGQDFIGQEAGEGAIIMEEMKNGQTKVGYEFMLYERE